MHDKNLIHEIYKHMINLPSKEYEIRVWNQIIKEMIDRTEFVESMLQYEIPLDIINQSGFTKEKINPKKIIERYAIGLNPLFNLDLLDLFKKYFTQETYQKIIHDWLGFLIRTDLRKLNEEEIQFSIKLITDIKDLYEFTLSQIEINHRSNWYSYPNFIHLIRKFLPKDKSEIIKQKLKEVNW